MVWRCEVHQRYAVESSNKAYVVCNLGVGPRDAHLRLGGGVPNPQIGGRGVGPSIADSHPRFGGGSGCLPSIECCDGLKRSILRVDSLGRSYARHKIIEHVLLFEVPDASSARPHAVTRWLAGTLDLCRRN